VLVCALVAEERAARRAGAPVVRAGLGASGKVPEGELVSFGLAGALTDRLAVGELVTATRVVTTDGSTLWEGPALAIAGARPVVVCAAKRVVDDRAERAALAHLSGADVLDMETGRLAASGRLAGVLRAVSDTPARRVGRLGRAAHDDGSVRWSAVAAAFALEPRRATAAARAARAGLRTLERAARELAANAEDAAPPRA
jgi:nucleoside phosphorylase